MRIRGITAEHRLGHDQVLAQAGGQRRATPRVRAGHGHGDPGPVADMPACCREYLSRARLGTLELPRQVADHAAGPSGQSQLDRPVQVLDGSSTEPTGNLKDHNPTYGVCSDTCLRGCDRPAGLAGNVGGTYAAGRVGSRATSWSRSTEKSWGILDFCAKANSIRWSWNVRTWATEVRE